MILFVCVTYAYYGDLKSFLSISLLKINFCYSIISATPTQTIDNNYMHIKTHFPLNIFREKKKLSAVHL